MPSTTDYKHHPHYRGYNGANFQFEKFDGDEPDPRKVMDLEDGRLDGLDHDTVLLAHQEQNAAWARWEAARRDRDLRRHLRRMPPLWDELRDACKAMRRGLERLQSGEVALHAAVVRLEDAHAEALQAARVWDQSAHAINLISNGDRSDPSNGEALLLLAPLKEIADRVCVDISGWPLDEDLNGSAPNNAAAERGVQVVIAKHRKHIERARSV